MSALIRWIKVSTLLGVLLLTFVFLINKGCEYFPESSFRLSDDSRMPKWITLPGTHTRANTSLTMDYLSVHWGGNVQFILRDESGTVLKKIYGREVCNQPLHLKGSGEGSSFDYPAYVVVTVDGQPEMIEHRKMEPIFYVTDDPIVWNQYKSMGCK